MKPMTWNRLATLCLLGGLALLPTGCGVFTARNPDFDNAETGENGQIYVLDDLEAIAADDTLSEDEKRAAYHDLGIEDEDLIDALLTL
ncbi:MAG: hypothetical protein H6817_03700 [Phycisphaerales bacterium]|nr:hypothetical protein [Phycisphaerales bacterium]